MYSYYENGKVESESLWENGEVNSNSILFYNEDGTVKEVKEF